MLRPAGIKRLDDSGVVKITAPDGQPARPNRRVFVGTLTPLVQSGRR